MVDKYLQSLTGQNERILLVTRQHWFILASAITLEILVTGVVIIGATIAMLSFPPAALAYLLVLVPLASLARDVLTWYNRQYIVTNRRVIQVSGVLNKSIVDSSLEKVNDVKMNQSFLGRLFDYGDVEILTASELGVNVFKRIGDPIRFKTAMLNAKENLGFSESGAPAASREGVPALIAQLDQLRQKGILTEEEFQKKKAELLAKL